MTHPHRIRRVLIHWSMTAFFCASPVHAETVKLKSVLLVELTGVEREQFVAAHNAARKMVGVDPVKWSPELSSYSLETLEQQKDGLVTAATEGWSKKQLPLPAHREESKYGENVAGWAGSQARTANWATTIWLREKKAFDTLNGDGQYRVGDEDKNSDLAIQDQKTPVIVGHYTAIVWRETKQIGAAKLECKFIDDQGNVLTYTAIICNYDPPGNRFGEKPY